jgi:hypothetical protein
VASTSISHKLYEIQKSYFFLSLSEDGGRDGDEDEDEDEYEDEERKPW